MSSGSKYLVLSERIKLDGWNVHAVLDEDGDLNIYIHHDSEATVARVGADIADNDQAWGDRFVIEGAEDDD